jgi:hypothetical protein
MAGRWTGGGVWGPQAHGIVMVCHKQVQTDSSGPPPSSKLLSGRFMGKRGRGYAATAASPEPRVPVKAIAPPPAPEVSRKDTQTCPCYLYEAYSFFPPNKPIKYLIPQYKFVWMALMEAVLFRFGQYPGWPPTPSSHRGIHCSADPSALLSNGFAFMNCF